MKTIGGIQNPQPVSLRRRDRRRQTTSRCLRRHDRDQSAVLSTTRLRIGASNRSGDFACRLRRTDGRIVHRTQAGRQTNRIGLGRDRRQIRQRRIVGNAVASLLGIQRCRLGVAKRLYLAQTQRDAVKRQDSSDDRSRIHLLFQQFKEKIFLRRRRHSRAARHVFGKIENERRTRAFWQTGWHTRTRKKRRRQQFARRALGSGVSSQRTQQANGLVDLAFEISRSPFCGLPRIAGANLHQRELPGDGVVLDPFSGAGTTAIAAEIRAKFHRD